MNLFKNEEIDFKSFRNGVAPNYNNELINSKYIKGDIRIVTEQARYPLDTIVSMIESKKYDLRPDFQRRHRWDLKRKSRLIESFIMNVPIPPIFLYEVTYSKYEVMDGLQRLTSIYQFYKDEYALQDLEEWKEINGLKYSELPEIVRSGIDRRYLSSIILLQETAKNQDEAQKMKQLVFERLNSGGVDLEDQEIRNALYDGQLNQLCIKLARNKYFCKMWAIPEPSIEEISSLKVTDRLLKNETYNQMQDVELILRFFAYRQIDKWESTSLKSFLDYFLRKGNYFDSFILYKYENLFNKTTELIYKVFGTKAFYLWRKRENANSWNWFSRSTKVIYDPMMYVFSQYIDKSNVILEHKEMIVSEITKFYEKHYNDFGGRSNNRNDVVRRIELFSKFLSDITGISIC